MFVERVQEAVTFDAHGLALSGVLTYPESDGPDYRALVCAPHPNFAGDMENNVVLAVADELGGHGVSLRFDYRGVGRSEIRLPASQNVWDYWQDIETQQAFEAPVQDTRGAWAFLDQTAPAGPGLAVGYSFGAVMAAKLGLACDGVAAVACLCPPLSRVDCGFLARADKPVLVVTCRRDFVYSQEQMDRIVSAGSERIRAVVLEEGDHFFRGEEGRLLEVLREFLSSTPLRNGERA